MLNRPESAGPEFCTSLQRDLVLLDLETTGTSASKDRIIEIGLVHFSRCQIVDQWSTLVNPQVALSRFIEDYTGINGEMLAAAPLFADISGELRRHLERGLLVAHNAHFDYGFLQSEFSRIGEDYQARNLCTVKLSRKLFPTEKRHGLDEVIRRHNLRCDNRHRALGDARALAGFLQDLPCRCSAQTINRAIASLL